MTRKSHLLSATCETGLFFSRISNLEKTIEMKEAERKDEETLRREEKVKVSYRNNLRSHL